MNVYCIAFRGTTSEKVLKDLNLSNEFYIDSNEDNIKLFVNNFKLENNSLILALGDYSGKDKLKLRIEKVCKNKFRNEGISNYIDQLDISENLCPQTKSKLAKGLGNSYCNLLSYLFASKLNVQCINIKYDFIHIPKEFNVRLAANEVSEIIKTQIK